jgi:ribosomal protein L11 methyltransferase
VAVAKSNVVLNGVRGRIRLVTAAGLPRGAAAGHRRFDLIVANILAGPLIRLAPGIARAIRPGGVVVLSGLLGEQMREVAGVYAMAGFRLAHHHLSHNWATLILERRSCLRAITRGNGRHQGAGRLETRRNLPDWAQDQ